MTNIVYIYDAYFTISRDRKKKESYYLANAPLKRSISAEKKVHGIICLT